MDLGLVFTYIFGLLFLYAVIRLLIIPAKYTVGVIYRAVLGAASIWIFNLALGFAGFYLPINPVTAICVGYLGFPGLGLLYIVQNIL
ncbi:MAG: pro-sigmaK processing inhibitor BofA family protein [Bacillota bacterium]